MAKAVEKRKVTRRLSGQLTERESAWKDLLRLGLSNSSTERLAFVVGWNSAVQYMKLKSKPKGRK